MDCSAYVEETFDALREDVTGLDFGVILGGVIGTSELQVLG